MGNPIYSSVSRTERAMTSAYYTAPVEQIFTSKSINNAMNPFGIKIRESRDSENHPNSLAIIIALDVTGSMGTVPHSLVKDGLPTIMETLISRGIKDPQILFLAIGDHECDTSPLQVAQFESGDAELDKWLTTVFLEGGGGGNAGESYLFAWYFAGNHTLIDCFEKRKQKGFLFTIGDEPTLKVIPKDTIKGIMDADVQAALKAPELLTKARETYEVFHLHISETSAGSRKKTVDGWKQLMSDNLIEIKHHDEVAKAIVGKILSTLKVPNVATDQPFVPEVIDAKVKPSSIPML